MANLKLQNEVNDLIIISGDFGQFSGGHNWQLCIHIEKQNFKRLSCVSGCNWSKKYHFRGNNIVPYSI
jgi:hypothetical protein